MQKVDLNLEQPDRNIISQGEVVSQEIEEDRVEINNSEGSKYGKFKDAETLLNAYNNLQSDYTKKCQALSQLQKDCEDKGLNKSPEQIKEEWEEKVEVFFKTNEKARKYEKELAKIIIEDKDIAKSDNPLNNAWDKFVKDNFFSKEELVSDENFLQNYILNNKDIKGRILKDYFSSLREEFSPTLIGVQKGSKTFLTPPSRPKSIKEAGKLVEEIL